MGPNFGVGQDAASVAYLKNAFRGDEDSDLSDDVDEASVVSLIDGGTGIPAQVDSPGLARKG